MKHFHSSMIILFFAAAFTGCAVYNPFADFTKQRYTNAISYFNTFYNAQRAFSDAEDEILKAQRDYLDRGTTSTPFVIPSSARQKFQTSVEKNSKVLSFYSNSKWVDEALMMIGMAYYYMQDDVRAERKFLELAVQFPGSSLIPESQLWLGKCLIRQKKYDRGLKQFESLFSTSFENNEDLAGRASNEIAAYYYSLREFVRAEISYSQAVHRVDDAELRAQIYFQIGKCFLEQQEYEKAEIAFVNAADVSPFYTLLFQSQLQMVQTKALRQHYDEAHETLLDMLGDSKNKEFFGIIHLEMANILELQGKLPEAVEKYRYIDTAFAKTEVAARAYFQLGKYYEEVEMNYDSTLVMYNKAKVEFSGSEITPIAMKKADVYNKYALLRNDLFKFDSLYTAEFNGPLSVDSSTTDEQINEEDSLSVAPPIVISPVNSDSIRVVDSVRIVNQLNKERARKTMLDSLERAIGRTKFELGGLFFLELQHADSALYWFSDVVNNYPTSEFVPRAMYTIAEIYRTLKNSSKFNRDEIYQKIISDYPDSPYANEARKNLGLSVVETERDSARDMFESAESLSESKNFEQAIRTYKKIADKYSSSSISSKALYTAGWHYENSVMNNDSAFAVYKRLISRYPASLYGTIVRPKITEYENEIKRIELEKQKVIDDLQLKEQQQLKAKEPKEKIITAPSDSLATPKNNL